MISIIRHENPSTRVEVENASSAIVRCRYSQSVFLLLLLLLLSLPPQHNRNAATATVVGRAVLYFTLVFCFWTRRRSCLFLLCVCFFFADRNVGVVFEGPDGRPPAAFLQNSSSAWWQALGLTPPTPSGSLHPRPYAVRPPVSQSPRIVYL